PFLVSSYGPHHHLHSFPTRRSSDLMPELFPAVTVPPSRNAGRRRASASADVSARGCSSRATTTDSPFTPTTVIGTICSSNRPASDRKSTRLNSSHGSISYAVFCLKK